MNRLYQLKWSRRIKHHYAPVAQLDRVLGYEPSGQRFESFRVRHLLSSNFSFYQKQLTLYLVIFLDHQWFLINNFLVCL
ncbi:unnamed protein product [Haemophilus parainfluenzae T3T1]|uniref:Uncharacterized protein n=1 Tax=Haemophilus parainfluenzae (strain T3T1) TaxID=862965 RepID=A0AB33QDZ8_HAEP3|nr:unnamed protein product [Haemophilus parainfluenzae T3T1]